MTLQSDGPISARDIQTEFGGTNPFRLSDYYAGGPNVPPGTEGDGGPIPESGTIRFSDFYGSSNTQVDVLGANLSHSTILTQAGVGYQLNSSGAEQSYENNGAFVTFNTWLIAGNAADFDCRLTVDSGDIPTGSAVGVWLGMGSTRTWELEQSFTGSKTNDCTIEIRGAVSLEILDTASVDMHVDFSPA